MKTPTLPLALLSTALAVPSLAPAAPLENLRSRPAGSSARRRPRTARPRRRGIPRRCRATCISICCGTSSSPILSIATTKPSCSGLKTRVGSTATRSTSRRRRSQRIQHRAGLRRPRCLRRRFSQRRTGADREQHVSQLARGREAASACRGERVARRVSFADQGGGARWPPPIRGAENRTPREKTYVRKAAYEYGWDWGPRFVTSGIWRPVHLEAWDEARISDLAHSPARRDRRRRAFGRRGRSRRRSSDGRGQSHRAVSRRGQAQWSQTRPCSLHAGRESHRSADRDRQARPLVSRGLRRQPLYTVHGTAESRRLEDRAQRDAPVCAPSCCGAIWTMGPIV